MSFEGYYQFLCKNGHNWEEDVHASSPEHEKCPYCGLPVIWSNIVDVTNGLDEYSGEVELECIGEEKCSECGCVKETIYKIPDKKSEEKNKFRLHKNLMFFLQREREKNKAYHASIHILQRNGIRSSQISALLMLLIDLGIIDDEDIKELEEMK